MQVVITSTVRHHKWVLWRAGLPDYIAIIITMQSDPLLHHLEANNDKPSHFVVPVAKARNHFKAIVRST